VERERQFDDRVEPWKRSVSRPHFLDENPAVPGAEHVDHAPAQDCFREPIGGLRDGVVLRLDDANQFTTFLQILGARTHGAGE
jgi:hypothetical protein